MGSPLSPIIANMVWSDLEIDVFASITIFIPVYMTLCRWYHIKAPEDQIKAILDKFNHSHNRIKFTVDYEEDRSINFLDVKLLIENGRIIFHLYKKPTLQENFLSNHLINHKKAVITS